MSQSPEGSSSRCHPDRRTRRAPPPHVSIPRRVQLSLSHQSQVPSDWEGLGLNPPKGPALVVTGCPRKGNRRGPGVSIPRRVQLSLSHRGNGLHTCARKTCLNPPKGPALVVTVSQQHGRRGVIHNVSIPRRVQLSLSPSGMNSRAPTAKRLNPPKGPALVVTSANASSA